MRKPSTGFRTIQIREDQEVTEWVARLDLAKKQDRLLKKSYDRVVGLIEENFLHGEVVPIPRTPKLRGITNLRCEDLVGFRRLLYTNIKIEEGTIALILTAVSHRDYERLFRGRGI